jgi:hypothetical protein
MFGMVMHVVGVNGVVVLRQCACWCSVCGELGMSVFS